MTCPRAARNGKWAAMRVGPAFGRIPLLLQLDVHLLVIRPLVEVVPFRPFLFTLVVDGVHPLHANLVHVLQQGFHLRLLNVLFFFVEFFWFCLLGVWRHSR